MPSAPVATLAVGPLARATTRVGPIASLVVLGLVLNLFAGNSQELGLPLSLDRPILLLAAVLLLVAKRPDWQRTPLLVVMLLTVLWTLWSWSATGSLFDAFKAFGLADRIVMPFALFLIGPAVFDTTVRRDFLLKALSLIGLYLGLTAMFQFLELHGLVYPAYARRLVLERATGPFASYEPLGMACVITMLAAALLVWRFHGGWRAVGIASVAASLLGVVLSQTRSVWLPCAIIILLFPMLVPRLRRWSVLVWIFVAAASALVAYQFPSFVDVLSDRLRARGPIIDRLLTNDGAVRAIEAHPWGGVGWLRFQEVSAEWVIQFDTLPLTNTNIEVHNVFLSRAAETGLIGALLWILAVMMGPVAAILVRPTTGEMTGWRMLAAGAFLVWLVPSMSSPNPYPFPNFLFWLITGIVAAPLVLRDRDPAAPRPGWGDPRGVRSRS